MTQTAQTNPNDGVQLPALHRQADAASNRKQSLFMWITKARLGLLVLVAGSGLASWPLGENGDRGDGAGVVAAVAFFGVFVLELVLWKTRPERVWYRARAVAESAKTLAWKYAVRGAPFDDEDGADELFWERLKALQSKAGSDVRPDGGPPDQITQWMRDSRADDFEARRALYRGSRIDDQIGWYGRKCSENERWANVWLGALVVVNLVGMTVAILRAIGLVEFDALGLVGTLAAVFVAWSQTRQHESLVAAYSTAYGELTIIREKVQQATAESWGVEVQDAEDAISREHTMWQASRDGTGPTV